MIANRTYTNVAELYAEHRSGLLAFLKRQVHSPELAEDLCHDTFVKAMRAWDTRDPQGSAMAWIYQIARNTAYDELRRRRRINFLPIIDDHLLTGDGADLENRVSAQDPVQRALARLPMTYRLPLVLHSFGFSVKEIAAMFDCPPNTLKARLFRGRGQFRKLYNGGG